MLKRFLTAAVLLLAACQSTPEETSTTVPIVNDATESPGWLETEMNGVNLGLWKPEGWETDLSDGLVLAEHSVTASGMIAGGMLVYIFVPPLEDFGVTLNDSNFAWAVLDKVVQMPSHTGRDVSVSQPAEFEWDQYDAAYYLLTTGDGVRLLVLALALPSEPKVVICNISIAANYADRIRTMLPELLDGLTVNGHMMSGTGLNVLPDPLPFPRYTLLSSADNHLTARGSP